MKCVLGGNCVFINLRIEFPISDFNSAQIQQFSTHDHENLLLNKCNLIHGFFSFRLDIFDVCLWGGGGTKICFVIKNNSKY